MIEDSAPWNPPCTATTGLAPVEPVIDDSDPVPLLSLATTGLAPVEL